jgi:hypothetical protein
MSMQLFYRVCPPVPAEQSRLAQQGGVEGFEGGWWPQNDRAQVGVKASHLG